MTKTDTIRTVARPRGVLSDDTLEDLAWFKERLAVATANYRDAVLDALKEGSFNEVSKATGLSKDTLQRWKREAGK